jgi:UDP-N-acetylglucosamine 1-carboxyvinyltransferase
MSRFIINGGKKLNGQVSVLGSKNAMFPLVAACLLTDETCQLTNVPQIQDTQTMISILMDLGVSANFSDHTLTIHAEKITKKELNQVAGQIRGSIVLLGALLARTKKVSMAFPGGDRIGKRPIDAHMSAFEALGAVVSTNGFIELSGDKLTGNKIVMEESSVTATENAILAAVTASGQTMIKLAAMEPHVQQLCEFLNLMGGKISGIGTTTIVIDGVAKLHGADIELIPDSNEATSLIVLAAATKSDVKISKLNPDFLEDVLLKLKKMQVNFQVGSDFVHVLPPNQDYLGAKIQCGLYPKLPSDDVPVFAVLATQAQGESEVFEWLYENRLGYIEQLKKMGANAEILDPHRVKILGPTQLTGQKLNTYDIRMGMTLLIAALTAQGQSEIDGVEHIDRGYENLEERLASIGADITRVK